MANTSDQTKDDFYSGLTPFYHLIYPDWDNSIKRQASALNSIVREIWGEPISAILDASCGIGTQSLGLAALGYKIIASDLSPTEIERAKQESAKRGLSIAFSVTDMKHAYDHHGCQFDLVISCDNSIPHLLTDNDILTAFKQFFLCTRPGGGCLISVRDYEKEDLSQQQVKACGTREIDGTRWILFQVWDPHGSLYDLTMYFIEDQGSPECRAHTFRTKYYAVGIPKLMDLMGQAGFQNVRRLDNRFFQPVIIGTRPQ